MKNDTLLGVVAGAIAASVSVAGNLLRADPHLVSAFPDMVSLFVVPFVVFVAARRRGDDSASAAIVRAGRTVAVVAGLVFATVLGSFTLWWLPRAPVSAALFGAASSFGLIVATGFIVAALCGRFIAKEAV